MPLRVKSHSTKTVSKWPIVEQLKAAGFAKSKERLSKGVWIKEIECPLGYGYLTIPESRPDIRETRGLSRQIGTSDVRATDGSEPTLAESTNPLGEGTSSSGQADELDSPSPVVSPSEGKEEEEDSEEAEEEVTKSYQPSFVFKDSLGKLDDESVTESVKHVYSMILSEVFLFITNEDDSENLPHQADASFNRLTSGTTEAMSSTLRRLLEENRSFKPEKLLDGVFEYALYSVRKMYLEALRLLRLGTLIDEVNEACTEISKRDMHVRLLKYSRRLFDSKCFPSWKPTVPDLLNQIFRNLEMTVFSLDSNGYLGEPSDDDDGKPKGSTQTINDDKLLYIYVTRREASIPKRLIPMSRNTLKVFLSCYLKRLPGQASLQKHLDILFSWKSSNNE